MYLLSLPPNWKANQGHIATCKTDGIHAVRSAWEELRQFGYISKEIVRDKGRIAAIFWHIYESSQTPEPISDSPICEILKTVDHTLRITEDKKDLVKNNDDSLFLELKTTQEEKKETGRKKESICEDTSETSAQAEAIYVEYPKRTNKLAALKEIKKALKTHSVEFLTRKVKAFSICKMATDPNFIKSPDKFFRDGNFLDDEASWTETPHAEFIRNQQQPKAMSAEERFKAREGKDHWREGIDSIPE